MFLISFATSIWLNSYVENEVSESSQFLNCIMYSKILVYIWAVELARIRKEGLTKVPNKYTFAC